MNEHRYPFDALTGDYIRAGAGIVVCGGPLPFLAGNLPAIGVLGSLTALFAYFGWRTFLRQKTKIHVDGISIEASGVIRTQLSWRNLKQVKLSYFSTKRDRRDGWMQLSIRTPEGSLRVDSHIQGFESLARHAYDAAVDRKLEMSQATHGNFQALGIHHDEPAGGWGNPSDWTAEAGSQ